MSISGATSWLTGMHELEEWQKYSSSILIVAAVWGYWSSVPSFRSEKNDAPHIEKKEEVNKKEIARCCLLPEDLIGFVVTYSSAKTIASATSSCRRLRVLLDDDTIWQQLFSRDFSVIQSFERFAKTEPNLKNRSWKQYYSEFSLSWIERNVVGANIENNKVWIGLRGAIYDVTKFVANHPGSPDTLLDFAGTDATELFEAVGHSKDAESIMKQLILFHPPSTGALHYQSHTFTFRRNLAKKAAPSACNNSLPNCRAPAVLANSPRLFFDADANLWRCWWPCCGQVVDIGSFSNHFPPRDHSDSSWMHTYLSSSIALPRPFAYARRLLFPAHQQ